MDLRLLACLLGTMNHALFDFPARHGLAGLMPVIHSWIVQW